MPNLKVAVNEQPSAEVVHRFRNFGEAAQAELGSLGHVSSAEADRATTALVVHDVKASAVGEARRVLLRLLRKHGFEGTVEVSRD